MATRNLPICKPLPTKCESLDVSQPYGPPRPFTVTVLSYCSRRVTSQTTDSIHVTSSENFKSEKLLKNGVFLDVALRGSCNERHFGGL
jgi:hypothetical protein